MYYLTGEVKRKFLEKRLGVPDNWKELVFYLHEADLGIIGGRKNIPRTYQSLCELSRRIYSVRYKNEKGNTIFGRIHWVDSFLYDKNKELYAVRISPEIMRFLINLNQDFTSFSLDTAMMLKSRFTQKMYELCCMYGGSFRFYDRFEHRMGNTYRERVVPISMESFRALFNLNEVRDQRTEKVITTSSYKDFSDIRRNIIEYAQKELYNLYMQNRSNTWFDYQPGPKAGVGGKVSSIIIYIYTREHPKVGEQRPWRKGDDPLFPFEFDAPVEKGKTPYQKLHSNMWYGTDNLDMVVCQLLSRYLTKNEVAYYMQRIHNEARIHKDSYVQVIQVLQEKENQPKFSQGTKQYKRNNVMDYALKENLKAYGWSIDPPTNRSKILIENDFFD